MKHPWVPLAQGQFSVEAKEKLRHQVEVLGRVGESEGWLEHLGQGTLCMVGTNLWICAAGGFGSGDTFA